MLVLKNLMYSVLVPAAFAVYLPLMIVKDRTSAGPWTLVTAIALFVTGAAVFTWCVWEFAAVGRATPFPTDAPKQLVVGGP